MAVDGTSLPHQTETLFADVIIPRHIAKAFTYLVPPALTPLIGVGGRVLVPFGRVILEGVVISLSNRLPINMKAASIKEIHALPHVGQDCILSPALFELSRKIAEYYVFGLYFPQCAHNNLPHGDTSPLSWGASH
jgi:primosomal protein N' (replication factor Y)